MLALVLAATAGGALVGAAGAFVGSLAQRASRIYRNDVFIARGEPPVKDVVWRPPYLGFALLGALLGAAIGYATESVPTGSAAGLLPMGMQLLSSALRVARAQLH